MSRASGASTEPGEGLGPRLELHGATVYLYENKSMCACL